MKPRTYSLPCGCKLNGPRYVSMCEKDQRAFDETHKRWAIERAAGNHSGVFIHTLPKTESPT